MNKHCSPCFSWDAHSPQKNKLVMDRVSDKQNIYRPHLLHNCVLAQWFTNLGTLHFLNPVFEALARLSPYSQIATTNIPLSWWCLNASFYQDLFIELQMQPNGCSQQTYQNQYVHNIMTSSLNRLVLPYSTPQSVIQ